MEKDKDVLNMWRILRRAEPVILIVLILTLLYFVVEIKAEGSKCVANPMMYSAKAVYISNGQNIECKCNIADNPMYYYWFNRTAWGEGQYELKPDDNPNKINFSEFKIK